MNPNLVVMPKLTIQDPNGEIVKSKLRAYLHMISGHLHNQTKTGEEKSIQEIKESVKSFVNEMDGQKERQWTPSTDKHEDMGVTFEIPLDGGYTVKYSFDFYVVDERDV